MTTSEILSHIKFKPGRRNGKMDLKIDISKIYDKVDGSMEVCDEYEYDVENEIS